MMIATLSLNWLNDDTGNKLASLVVLVELFFDFSQAAEIFLFILLHIVLKWVFVAWEAGDGPVHGWDVEFVDRLGVSCRESAQGAPMETTYERQ